MQTIYQKAFHYFFILCSFSQGPVFAALEDSPETTAEVSEEGKSFDRYRINTTLHTLRLVNRNAPKGGTLSFPVIGGPASSLNPFVSTDAPEGIYSQYTRGMVVLPLMIRCSECPFEMRACCAKKMRKAKDNSWITFYMDPKARFHDGTPITASDVKATFEYFCKYGTPYRKHLGAKIARINVEGPEKITFYIKPLEGKAHYDPEFPLVLAGLPVLSKEDIKNRNNTSDLMKPLKGNGPYKLEHHTDSVTTYKRIPDFWGKDLPDFQGIANADIVQYKRFVTKDSALSAFRRGEVDVWGEENPEQWKRSSQLAHHVKHNIKVHSIQHNEPVGMMGFFLNLRVALFQDIRVRRALGAILDLKFHEFQRVLGPRAQRIRSFFQGTEYAAPQELTLAEKVILHKLPVPPEDFEIPKLDNKHAIFEYLKQSGWRLKDHTLQKNNVPMVFTIIVKKKEERVWAERFIMYLNDFGIKAKIREVDQAAYNHMLSDKNFDVVVEQRRISLAPGAEQISYWSAEHRGAGGKNYAGVNDPNIDFACQQLIASWDQKAQYTAWMHILDRLLKLGCYVLPLHYYDTKILAHWKRLGVPDPVPHIPDSPPITSYWVDSNHL